MPNSTATPVAAVTPEGLLAHWQGHRRITRRMIEAYPEDKLFTYSIGGMRTFGQLAMEIVTMGAAMVRGTVTGEWDNNLDREARPKAELLRLWDDATKQIDELWVRIPSERFQETITAFGMFTGVTADLLLYVIDNEIHHRGQAYVYMRSLGLEPPAFYDRT